MIMEITGFVPRKLHFRIFILEKIDGELFLVLPLGSRVTNQCQSSSSRTVYLLFIVGCDPREILLRPTI